jgi:MraZ protein
VPELLGEHRYQLDPKGRISLPAKFRDAFDEGLYLTLGQEGCLFGFPKEEWDRRREEVELRGLTDPRARAYARVFMAYADRIELDGQGRLVIPQKLRQKAGLAREVVVTGAGARLDIWSPDAWDRYLAAYEAQYISGTLAPPPA